MEKKYFTLDEANSLVPTLELKLNQVVRIKQEIADIVTGLIRKQINVEKLFAMNQETLDELGLGNVKKKLAELGVTLNEGVEEIQELGGLVKDMALGSVDFYALVDGQDIFYCWQLGEQEVRYWHSVNEGFANRRPLFEEDEAETREKFYH